MKVPIAIAALSLTVLASSPARPADSPPPATADAPDESVLPRGLAHIRRGPCAMLIREPASLAPPIFLALGLSVALAPIGGTKQPSADSCIKYWGEARFGGVGYSHIVHIANACTTTADCVVTTDVNPEAHAVEVAGKSEVLVNTFLDSPARTFTAYVKCTMRK